MSDLATLSIISLAFGMTLGYLYGMTRYVVEVKKSDKKTL
jgi:hypothetical protein